MLNVYPVIISPAQEGGYTVYVPDFDINTQADTLPDAFAMARDAIGLVGIDMLDDLKPLPKAADVKDVKGGPGDLVTLVDIDFEAYRKAQDTRAVRKNVSLPAWMAARADQAGINCSQLLQEAIRQQLNLR